MLPHWKHTQRIIVLAVVALLLCHAALAEETATQLAGSKSLGKLWAFLATSSFAAGLIFLFIAATVTAYVARKIRDRCLKTFQRYQVTVEMKDGTWLHGRLGVERTGMEFTYMPEVPQHMHDPDESSYLLFQNEYPRMYLLLRYHDYLSEKERSSREAEGLRAFQRRLMWRVRRKIRNAFASFKDAFLEALNMVIGRIKGGTGAGASVIGTQQRYVSQAGTSTISYLAENSFDPLLERLIGKRVIVESLKSPTEIHRFEGKFIEYSGDFLMLLDVQHTSQWSCACVDDGVEIRCRNILLARSGGSVRVTNPNAFSVTVELLASPAAEDGAPASPPVKVSEETIGPDGSAEFQAAELAGQVLLRMTTLRMADVIIPRAIGLVRHKAE